MTRSDLIKKIEQEKIIAIVRGVSKEKLLQTAEALYDGGIRLIEITYTTSGTISDETTAEMIMMLAKHFQEEMCVGAGTVTKVEQVDYTKQSGGSFIISPDAFEPVIRRTRELDMVSMPGALTPTEVQTAVRAGADFVKIFPASAMGGISYIKAIAAPLTGVKMLAVGGIDHTNMREYLQAGAKGFGVGTNIVNKKLIEANDYVGLTALAKKYVEALKD